MYPFVCLLFIAVLCPSYGEVLPKCCPRLHEMVHNSSYTCANESTVMRWQLVMEDDDFLAGHVDGYCKEALGHAVYKFEVRGGNVKMVGEVHETNYTSKCCPLGHVYDPHKHACTRVSEPEEEVGVFRIGLSHCQVVVDQLDETSKAEVTDGGDRCSDRTTTQGSVLRWCHNSTDVCDNKIRCIRKCCPDGQSFVNTSKCVDTHTRGVNLSLPHLAPLTQDKSPTLGLLHGYTGGVVLWMPPFTLDPDGWVMEKGKINSKYGYCMEHVIKRAKNMDGHYMFLVTSRTQQIATKILINRYVLCLSCVFLVCTVLTYMISKEVKKMFGKILVSLCSSLLSTFILLIYNGFNANIQNSTLCVVLGYMLCYFGFTCFAWLNVMCYDIYSAFSSPKKVRGMQKQLEDRKKLTYYCLYGWGVPLVLMVIIALLSTTDLLPYALKIIIGKKKCLIENRIGNFGDILFYIGPMCIQEIINIVMFIKTIIYLVKVKNEINKMNDTNAATKEKKQTFNAKIERFSLILKLFIIMGMSFIFEVVSSFYDFQNNTVTKYIEVVWDVINSLQGVFIFIIFACKRKIWEKLKLTTGIDKMRRSSITSAFTQSTQVTNTKVVNGGVKAN